MGNLAASLGGLPDFLVYFSAGALLIGAFAAVYCRLTTHDEFALIRAGNVAAAIAFGGNLLGFSIPLDRAISQASGLLDCALWAGIAAIVQWLAYVIARWLIRDVSAAIVAGNLAVATLLAILAVAAGLLNAAAMTL